MDWKNATAPKRNADGTANAKNALNTTINPKTHRTVKEKAVSRWLIITNNRRFWQ